MSVREWSSYAFNEYGGDAKLYNGIHDLETDLSTLRSRLEAAEKKHHDYRLDHPLSVDGIGSLLNQLKEQNALCDELATALRKLQDGRTMRCDEPCGVIWCRWCYARAALARYDAQSAKEGK